MFVSVSRKRTLQRAKKGYWSCWVNKCRSEAKAGRKTQAKAQDKMLVLQRHQSMKGENVLNTANNPPSVTPLCAKATNERARVCQSSTLMIMMKIAQTMVVLNNWSGAPCGKQIYETPLCDNWYPNKTVRFKLDSGAFCNVISEETLKSCSVSVNLEETEQVISMHNHTTLKPVGECTLELHNRKTDKPYCTESVVLKEQKPPCTWIWSKYDLRIRCCRLLDLTRNL